MCPRYALTGRPPSIAAYFKLAVIDPFPPRYNIAPTQPVGIVRMGHRGEREFVLVRWGLIPPWVKDPRAFSTLINARAEGAATKPSFRGAMRHKRCLIPADAFYEWSGEKKSRRPHLVRRRDGGTMALAGLYENWLGADGSEIETMAILTVPANGTVGAVHDRMPAIIQPEDFEAWLDCRGVLAEAAAELLRPAADDLLEVFEIGPEIGNPRNEGPELQQPLRPTLL
jgi:putative SOS response-associated peptidase YedK